MRANIKTNPTEVKTEEEKQDYEKLSPFPALPPEPRIRKEFGLIEEGFDIPSYQGETLKGDYPITPPCFNLPETKKPIPEIYNKIKKLKNYVNNLDENNFNPNVNLNNFITPQEIGSKDVNCLNIRWGTNNATNEVNTSQMPELTNLFWTQARFNIAFGNEDTDDLTEGGSNLYFNCARVLSCLTPDGVDCSMIKWGINNLENEVNTDQMPEGAVNKFFTCARARLCLSATSPICYNNSTGVISECAGYSIPTDAQITEWNNKYGQCNDVRPCFEGGEGIDFTPSSGRSVLGDYHPVDNCHYIGVHTGCGYNIGEAVVVLACITCVGWTLYQGTTCGLPNGAGNSPVRFSVPANATTGLVAQEGTNALLLADKEYIEFKVKSSIDLDAGDYKLVIDGPYANDFDILFPKMLAGRTYIVSKLIPVNCQLDINSTMLECNVDKGPVNIDLYYIRAVKVAFNYNTVSGNFLFRSQLLASNGTAALPTYSFENDPNTGIYCIGTDSLGFSTAGEKRMEINATGNIGVGYTPGTAIVSVHKLINSDALGAELLISGTQANGSYEGISFGHRPDSGYRKAAIFFRRDTSNNRGSLHFCMNNAGDVSNATISDSVVQITKDGQLLVDGRTAGSPSISFLGATTIGIYKEGTGLGFSTAGTKRVKIDSGGITGLANQTFIMGETRLYDYVASDQTILYSRGESLRLAGTAYSPCASVVAASYNICSARRYKEDIVDLEIDDILFTLKKLRPREFIVKEKKDTQGNPKKSCGFVAEELVGIIDKAVHKRKNHKTGKIEVEGVNYAVITTYLTKMVQRQQEEIDFLKSRN